MSNDRVRVGFVVHAMQVAGAEILIARIIDRLQDTIEPTVFCLDGQGELGSVLAAQGIPVVVLHRVPGIDCRLPFRFARELRERRIEVIHAHQYAPFFYSAMARLCGCWKTKILFTEHGRHYPDVVSFKRRLINRLILRRWCDQATACCQFSAAAVEEKEGIFGVETIRNGVDIVALQPLESSGERVALRQRLGLVTDVPYVTCIARFHPVKDHATLLRAWRRVHPSVPQARLILVGDGSERTTMEAYARELEISSSVAFWGLRKDTADILKAADLFVLPSLSEASSLTMLEAMAVGCPVVATAVGGNPEHLTHEREGLLVPRGNDEAMAQAILRMLNESETRRRFSFAARRRVEKEFDLSSIISRYYQLYRHLGKT